MADCRTCGASGANKSGYCRPCNAERTRAWVEANPERASYLRRRSHMRRKYGIEPEEYDERLVAQEGRCAICGADEPGYGRKYFAVDHDHGTGGVRGLLCIHCNLALGHAKDSPFVLESAVRYLENASVCV